MEIATILTLLEAVPGIFQAAASVRADLGIADQAALDAAISRARTGALAAVAQADVDLDAAARS